MSTRGAEARRAIESSLDESRKPALVFRRPREAVGGLPAGEESALRILFAWAAGVRRSALGRQLEVATKVATRRCPKCSGTGFAWSTKELELEALGRRRRIDPEVVDSVPPEPGDTSCPRCNGIGHVLARCSGVRSGWYAPGVRNCSGSPLRDYQAAETGSSVPPWRGWGEPDADGYKMIGGLLSRLRRLSTLHASALEVWYGGASKAYDPMEIPLTVEESLRALQGAHRHKRLVLPKELPEDEHESELQRRLRSYVVEQDQGRELVRQGRRAPPLTPESLEVDGLLLPLREARADEYGRLEQLCGLWPASPTGRKALAGISTEDRSVRDTARVRKGGAQLVAKADQEAERLITRAQRAWLDTLIPPADPNRTWRQEWAEYRAQAQGWSK